MSLSAGWGGLYMYSKFICTMGKAWLGGLAHTWVTSTKLPFKTRIEPNHYWFENFGEKFENEKQDLKIIEILKK